MNHVKLDWNAFLKRIASFTDKDIEFIAGSEVFRGPVRSVAYDSEGHITISLDWVARLGDDRRQGWIIDETIDSEIALLITGFRILEWRDGRVSLDDPKNPMAPTYTFLTKESKLKYVRSF